MPGDTTFIIFFVFTWVGSIFGGYDVPILRIPETFNKFEKSFEKHSLSHGDGINLSDANNPQTHGHGTEKVLNRDVIKHFMTLVLEAMPASSIDPDLINVPKIESSKKDKSIDCLKDLDKYIDKIVKYHFIYRKIKNRVCKNCKKSAVVNKDEEYNGNKNYHTSKKDANEHIFLILKDNFTISESNQVPHIDSLNFNSTILDLGPIPKTSPKDFQVLMDRLYLEFSREEYKLLFQVLKEGRVPTRRVQKLIEQTAHYSYIKPMRCHLPSMLPKIRGGETKWILCKGYSELSGPSPYD